ncbi:hypothetical protein [Agromyces laixinhei]|uniref:hypothetical protein n=1 Tax=Agromyces laixinhei TaxID=2585717 RepID=UPI0012EE4892|nr:hypothetical protein [Agromyces laixinhei]
MPTCTKTRYRDRIAAMLVLAQIHDKASRPKQEARVYFCDDCRGWHLTSRKRWR